MDIEHLYDKWFEELDTFFDDLFKEKDEEKDAD